MKSDAGLARKTAIPAKSSPVPQRPSGVRASTRSWRPGICLRAAWVSSVSIQPGRTALTWMWSRAQADAIAFVSCTMPPLLAAYGPAKDAPKIDIIEPTLMILPRPAFVISGWTALEQRKDLVEVVAGAWRQS